MAGRLAPFIELGVGFNPELTARENVRPERGDDGPVPARGAQRLDAVLEFAELEEFADLKLKNYSSGMLVRLAFSVMIQAEADVLLIDEVLAVGDAAFQQKCADVFREMKRRRPTIVLVTHDMAAVAALLPSGDAAGRGRQLYIGDPAEAGREYLQMNFDKRRTTAPRRASVRSSPTCTRGPRGVARERGGERISTWRRASRSGSRPCWRPGATSSTRTSTYRRRCRRE